MRYAVTEESFASLTTLWTSQNHLRWSSIFVLPTWLQVWWQEFGNGDKPLLLAVRQGEQTTGIAPLLLREGKASFLGSTDVCDYLDFIIAPNREKVFFNTLLDDLEKKGIEQLDLGAVRPDSTVITTLVTVARERGYEVQYQPEAVSVELDLPATWEKYLAILDTKQRHELKRKLRRASAEGKLDYRLVSDRLLLNQTIDAFLKMFTESRRDKATFLTPRMEAFFRSLVSAMAQIGLARFGILELDSVPTAIILYFDYNDYIYLYNSSYDPRYESLSVGLLCKVLGIESSILTSKKKFDFLKGNEPYKYYLGGKEIPLYRCQITIR
tara:strand:+ start:777 stop:1754 length:978 start_codon:yes stop_codon:yes gene_type:complete